MSLLDNGPHTVTVQSRVVHHGMYGDTVTPSGDPITVRGSLQPVAAQSTDLHGGSLRQGLWRFITRTWPGVTSGEAGPSQVTLPGGITCDVIGAEWFQMSRGTTHWEVMLRENAGE